MPFMRLISGSALLWLAVMANSVSAALPPVPESVMFERATHVVAGTVLHINEAEDRSKPGQVWIAYTATVRVHSLIKGEGFGPGDTIRIHYWHRYWLPGTLPVIGNDGYYAMPRVEESLKLYLMRWTDNEFTVVFPNGFSR